MSLINLIKNQEIEKLLASLLVAIQKHAQEVQSQETTQADDKLIIKGTGLSYEELIQKPNAQEILINLHNRMVGVIDELEERVDELERNI
jgi:hypothetical protein